MIRIILVLLFFFSNIYAWEKCLYSSIKDDELLTAFNDCAKIDKNQKLQIKQYHKSNIKFYDNLTCIYVSKKTYYYHKNGTSFQAVPFDNGCDYFDENKLARVIINNKISYVNKDLKIILPTNFFYATRFYNKKAIVCNNGIKKIKDGEHFFYRGGVCNLMNLKGELLLKENTTFEEVSKLLK
ncbi:hypothetical protein CPU12_01560 [Malaciobacter molluscorum LMG 25693]|uniref:Uncharacterized protein n=1 Tax=Malaciobacter molluscorum LMG 25693 TaxID=870501 RepID=A0A2G1DKF9_9BACT|nr:hypothetical protein [Malaciobacter molluscorum]AXX92533.1 hypothetical protein AMOL_1564 [Malaciobacter molluscorum LMG 25693]PHO18959.1 hypothetical protein CPU12_01560 [Malaciobacter molluscorum LMG 25693]RXJ97263.1 hypothetical protein CRV00_00040 [Malaciobacter molluscorum]